jgi:hypothetical protein
MDQTAIAALGLLACVLAWTSFCDAGVAGDASVWIACEITLEGFWGGISRASDPRTEHGATSSSSSNCTMAEDEDDY